MGLFSNLKQRLGRRRNEPHRDTEAYPRLMQILSGQRVGKGVPVFKPTPWNLRSFSTTPYARRAINTIKNPIAQLGWEVVPKKGVEENSEIQWFPETSIPPASSEVLNIAAFPSVPR
jgi:hypothetical protein